MKTIRIACLQSKGFPSKAEAVEAYEKLILQAAQDGAQIICTQELCATPYFCQTQNPEAFDLAEPVPGPTVEHFAALAKRLEVVLVLSLFERATAGVHYNTAVVIDTDGRIAGRYRKSHLPQDPGFEEKYYFAPGNTGFHVVETARGRIGVLVCWDQWFPEAARILALAGADVIVCPTAIGWLPEEKPRLGEDQLRMWRTVQEGHAIANSCYWAAMNRVGTEGDIEFWGTSFVTDFMGRTLACASKDQEEILMADLDLDAQVQHRRDWPFFRDRRPELYTALSSVHATE